MTFPLAWLGLPLLFGAISYGCGVLLERACSCTLPPALRVPAGFAVVLVCGSLTTMNGATAGLTVPLVCGLAVAGYGLAVPFRPRPDWSATAAAAGVYGVYAAPIVLSGSATFAGYITLDDTATWFAFADNALTHGRSLAGLAPSTVEAVLHDNLPTGYPLGSFVPLGIGHELTRVDVAWLFQPYIAFLASLLALCVYAIVTPFVARRPLRALVALIGAQPALLYGYAFWSGIKEMTVAYLVALSAGLAAASLRSSRRLREGVPVAFAAAALLVCLSVLGVVFLAGLGGFVVLLVSRRGGGRASRSLAFALVVGAAFALPALTTAAAFVEGADKSDSGHNALGNLFHPLSALQLGGVWPAGDFRGRPVHMLVVAALLVVVAGCAAFALVRSVQRRSWGLVLYVSIGVAGWLLVALLHALGHGSAWLDAKALAEASPCLLVGALAGGAALFAESRWAPAGVAALALIAGGVLWSNALAYGDVWLAPRSQLAELQTIGDRFAGDGPTLMTEYQPYGVRHFLRRLDAEGTSERRTRLLPLRSGGSLDRSQYADLDAFDLDGLLAYRTLVLRRSPLASRPPSVYVPVWSGRFYEVWQRTLAPATILEHVPLGTADDPNGVPSCSDVRRLAALAAEHRGTVVASVRPAPTVVRLADLARPASWLPGAQPGTVLPAGTTTLSGAAVLPRSGRNEFFLGGSFRDDVQLRVDARRVGSARNELEQTDQLAPLGSAQLAGGLHQLELRYTRNGLLPGSRGAQFLLGPLVIGLPATAARLVRVAPGDAGSLCGRRLDWLEAVAGGY